jgi:hypothetical protein
MSHSEQYVSLDDETSDERLFDGASLESMCFRLMPFVLTRIDESIECDRCRVRIYDYR